MVSHKANATRKRMNIIAMFEDTQLIFIDTPGIHKQEKLLNQFMLKEVLRATSDCDFLIFLAPVTDSIVHYEEFLDSIGEKKHALMLSKVDTSSNEMLLKKIEEYSKYKHKFCELIPLSVKRGSSRDEILKVISKYMPSAPYLYDPEDLTTSTLRDIYKEMIRESIFENISDEIPYESDVIVDNVEEGESLDKIYATIVLEKESQKGMVIGKGGATIKRVGKTAREKIEKLLEGKKVFLKLSVSVLRGWSKNEENLLKFGYRYRD